ncbi:MAG: ATP-binding cassette domain-containing protein [Bacteroidales bacterium]|nr:ATP-binding cassette domain-containing protein [Bacteroidales bacterium]
MEQTPSESQKQPIVWLENVSIKQNGQPLLHEVNLRVEEGEFVYMIGKSGTGKTTLLRSLYADCPIESGRAQVCGIDVATIRSRRIPALRRRIGVAFQDFRLLPDRDVYSNLEFVLRATGWKRRAEISNQILTTLASVGIEDKASAFPSQLSDGEQQRVGIARALINKPSLILADEPTGNLDPITSSEIMQLLINATHRAGVATLISTHDFMTIDRFPSRVVVCENGTLNEAQP